jgi:Flp pilus assembly protein TadD
LFFAGAETSATANLPQAATSPSVDGLLQDGLQAYRAHQLSRAITKLRQAYKLAPADPHVRLLLGLMLYDDDSASPEAQGLMESVSTRFPNNVELQLKLLDSYLRGKNQSKLFPLLARLEGTMAGNHRFAFDVVYTLVRYGQIETARSELDKASTCLQPRMMGLSEQDLKSPVHRALRQEVGEMYFGRGLLAATENKKDEALRLFHVADGYEFPSQDSPQMQMLSEGLFRLEEYSLAAQAYEVCLKSRPLNAEARMHLALSYYYIALMDRAKENFEEVLKLSPQVPEVNLYLGLTLLELKENQEARRHFLEELKYSPQSYQAMAELAYLDYLDGDNENCRQWLEKARQLNPDWYEVNMVSGLLYNRQGQFDQAIPCLERVTKDRPNYYKAHFQLSLAYRRSGNETKAKEHADIYDRLVAEEKARMLGARAPTN